MLRELHFVFRHKILYYYNLYYSTTHTIDLDNTYMLTIPLVAQKGSVGEADPDLGFMARLMALCLLGPRQAARGRRDERRRAPDGATHLASAAGDGAAAAPTPWRSSSWC